GVPFDLAGPRYNVAPTQFIPLVRPAADRPGREVATAKWGLVPSWAEDPGIGSRMINARSETVATKPAFRSAFKKRRCLVPATGFYEWEKVGAKKLPHLFTVSDGRPFALAGLWESWHRDGEELESFTIVTTEANELLAKYHDRMPVIVHPNDYDLWLRGAPQEVGAVLQPYPTDRM